ncbi:MAG TPA: 50S ribosomal protein L25 [Anaerolineaceae bacterium]|nr:50S ribosomal protein L25 [Anaerolineaceae bacterium]
MEKFEINAEKRTVTGKKVSVLRREGKLPGVIYGHKVDQVAILMDLKEATKVLNKVTSSTIISINLEGKQLSALVRERQKNYMKNLFIHVDFQAVSLTEKIRTHVNVEFSGIAPAVKDFNGVVVEGLSSVEVEALPTDLPERFVIDISVLKNIGDAIYVKDIQIPQGVDIHTPAEEMVVLITPPAGEEVEEPLAEGAAEPEVIEKGKKDEEVAD